MKNLYTIATIGILVLTQVQDAKAWGKKRGLFGKQRGITSYRGPNPSTDYAGAYAKRVDQGTKALEEQRISELKRIQEKDAYRKQMEAAAEASKKEVATYSQKIDQEARRMEALQREADAGRAKSEALAAELARVEIEDEKRLLDGFGKNMVRRITTGTTPKRDLRKQINETGDLLAENAKKQREVQTMITRMEGAEDRIARSEYEAKATMDSVVADHQRFNAEGGTDIPLQRILATSPTDPELVKAIVAEGKIHDLAVKEANEMFAEMKKSHLNAELLLTNMDRLKSEYKFDEIKLVAVKNQLHSAMRDTLLGEYFDRRIEELGAAQFENNIRKSCDVVTACMAGSLGNSSSVAAPVSGTTSGDTAPKAIAPPATTGEGPSERTVASGLPVIKAEIAADAE